MEDDEVGDLEYVMSGNSTPSSWGDLQESDSGTEPPVSFTPSYSTSESVESNSWIPGDDASEGTVVDFESETDLENNAEDDLDSLVNAIENPDADTEQIVPTDEEDSSDTPNAPEAVVESPPRSPEHSNDDNAPTNNENNVSSDEPPAKMMKLDLNESDVDGNNCPICFEPWTNAGEHRTIALKCGHLFGHSCIVRWIRNMNNKTCPTCKTKATQRDIRFIYAKMISCVDTTEIEAVKSQLLQEQCAKTLAHGQIRMLLDKEIALRSKIVELEATISVLKQNKTFNSGDGSQWRFCLEKNLEIAKLPACRVFLYHKLTNSLYISQSNYNQIFSNYSLRQLDCNNFRFERNISMHSKEIRAVVHSEHSDLIMSVSLDKEIKLISPTSSKVAITIPAGVPLWSCCWDVGHSNRLYVGSVGGIVMQYDTRQTKSFLHRIEPASDYSPVVSVASMPGGAISCQLNSIRYHRKISSDITSTKLPLDGPFLNSIFDAQTQQLVISTRANNYSNQSSPSKHTVYNVGINGNDISHDQLFSFTGSSKTTFMSKPSLFTVGNQYMFAAYSEDQRVINIWNINDQRLHQCISMVDHVMDITSWTDGEHSYLAALGQSRVKIFQAHPR